MLCAIIENQDSHIDFFWSKIIKSQIFFPNFWLGLFSNVFQEMCNTRLWFLVVDFQYHTALMTAPNTIKETNTHSS